MLKVSSAFLPVLFLFIGCHVCHGQQATSTQKLALIKELLSVTGGKDSDREISEAMRKSQREEIPKLIASVIDADKTLPAEDKEKMKQMMSDMVGRTMDKFTEFFEKEIDIDQMVEQVVTPIYDKNFSEAELRELIGIYRTPVFQKSMKLAPELVGKMMSVMFEKLGPKMQEFINKTVEAEFSLLKQRLQDSKKTPVIY